MEQLQAQIKEFPHLPFEERGGVPRIPQEVLDFPNTLPQDGPEAPLKILPPFWFASPLSGNPMWAIAWVIIRSKGN